jgi:SOS-response transcriptional repressor LexA
LGKTQQQPEEFPVGVSCVKEHGVVLFVRKIQKSLENVILRTISKRITTLHPMTIIECWKNRESVARVAVSTHKNSVEVFMSIMTMIRAR